MKFNFSKIFILFFLILEILLTNKSQAEIKLKKIKNIGALSNYYLISIKKLKKQKTKKVLIISPLKDNYRKIVVILPGYNPGNDPYKQAPVYFLKNWNLGFYAKKYSIKFIIPNMGKTVYPLINNELIPDLTWLEKITQKLNSKKLPLSIIGLSTGAEGAIKLLAVSKQNFNKLILLSGTYDYFSLSKKSGEYLIHRKIFGRKKERWLKENPLQIIKKLTEKKSFSLHLFCEKNSIYYDQTLKLYHSYKKDFPVFMYPDHAKKHYHNWDFWGQKKICKKIISIIIHE